MNTDQHVGLFIYSRMVEHAVLTLRVGRALITEPRPVAAPTERQLLAVRVASALFRTLVAGGGRGSQSVWFIFSKTCENKEFASGSFVDRRG